MARRVDFLIAGVQKAGTTALHHFLLKHPQVVMPKCKELHFFDDESVDWRFAPYVEYECRFPVASSGQMLGEATPIYTFWPPAIERIARYNPNVLLIVILRNPVDRAFSHWRMETDRGVETLDFGAAVRRGRLRLNSSSLGSEMRNFSYVERGFYAQQVSRIFSFFPRSQVLFCTMESMLFDFQSVFNRVSDFLGVARLLLGDVYQVRPLPLGKSAGSFLSEKDARYLETLYAEDIRRTQILTGLNLGIWRSSPLSLGIE